MLQNELQIKRKFVRYVSHEIRTPLNTVFMGLQVLWNDLHSSAASADILRTVKSLEGACEVAVDILNDLLLFDKLDSGILKLDLSCVPVKQFLIETVDPFRLQVGSAYIAGLTFLI